MAPYLNRMGRSWGHISGGFDSRRVYHVPGPGKAGLSRADGDDEGTPTHEQHNGCGVLLWPRSPWPAVDCARPRLTSSDTGGVESNRADRAEAERLAPKVNSGLYALLPATSSSAQLSSAQPSHTILLGVGVAVR